MSKHPTPESNSTPQEWNAYLYDAVSRGAVQAIEHAIHNGANVNSRHGDGFTPCLTAALNVTSGNRLEVTRLLLDNGADPNLANKRGFTSLHMTVNGNQGDLAELLLDYGANPNVYNKTGRLNISYETPLHEAARKNRANVIGPLLKAGADPLLVNDRGVTASQTVPELWISVLVTLDDYAQLPRVEITPELQKADLLAQTKGLCALDNPVTWRQWPQIVEQLAEKGEHFSAQELLQTNKNGASYLRCAAEAHMLDAALDDLNSRGETITIQQLLEADAGMREPLSGHHAPNAVMRYGNLSLQSEGAVRRNLAALPDEGRAQVTGMHTLNAALNTPSQKQLGR